MQIHQLVKNAIMEHKQKIELTQWAIISGISSLIYSEYIRRIKRKEVPVKMILVPAIKNVSELLRSDSSFMEKLSNELIDSIANHPLIQKYFDAPELIMFHEENIEIMKTIFDLYIIPNISRRIPETIAKKFGLNDDKQQTFHESWEIDLFNRHQITNDQIDFIIEETVLQLLMLLPTMKKEIEIPEENINIKIAKDEILTIANENAICPIHFNSSIFKNSSVKELLSFVTNSDIKGRLFKDPYGNEVTEQKNGSIVEYTVTTGIFNQVSLTRLNGIEYNIEGNE